METAAQSIETYNPDKFCGDPPVSDAEKALEFEFDPKHDYFADLEHIQPGWVPPVAQYGLIINNQPSAAAFSEETGLREVRVVEREGKRSVRRTRTMPHKRYVRAVDPSGNICALIVSTCRPDADPDSPGKRFGDDGLGTFDRVIGLKQRRGWLVVERGDQWNHPHAPYSGQKYAAWCLAVAQYRKATFGEWLRAEQSAWMEERKRQAVELAKIQGAALGDAMREALRESAPAIAKARRAESKE